MAEITIQRLIELVHEGSEDAIQSFLTTEGFGIPFATSYKTAHYAVAKKFDSHQQAVEWFQALSLITDIDMNLADGIVLLLWQCVKSNW
eukprot:m.131952 g.131952  ORF g.131952 m.131952 type:complete len:89 (+) comp38059_c0_seq1:120-386(+)